MSSAEPPAFGLRLLGWASWLSLAVAVLAAIAALFSQWGINADSMGARDAGLALYFAFVVAFVSVGCLYAVPILALVGVLSLFFQRNVGFRFLAAGAVAAVPIAVLTLFRN
jgi:hypothetical protein